MLIALLSTLIVLCAVLLISFLWERRKCLRMPWWKTDYFEVRFENPVNNKRYFYQLDGEGIRYEILSFVKSIETLTGNSYIDDGISEAIVQTIADFYNNNDVITI